MTGPKRITDHYHQEMWTRAEQHRHEDQVGKRMDGFEERLESIGNRILMMLGALGLVAFLLPIIAPFLRALLNIDVPPGQGQ